MARTNSFGICLCLGLFLAIFLPQSSFADTPSKTEAYKAFLSQLDPKNVSSIQKSIDKYQQLYQDKSDPESQSRSLMDWEEFRNNVLSALNQDFGDRDKLFHENIQKALEETSGGPGIEGVLEDEGKIKTLAYVRTFRKNGFEIMGSMDGGLEVGLIADFEKQIFSSYMSLEEMELQNLRKGAGVQLAEDGQMVLPWEEMRKRLLVWEDYLKRYPKTKHEQEVRSAMAIYFKYYLGGVDVTRIFEETYGPHMNGKLIYDLKPEVQQSYSNFITQNKGSEHYEIVRKFYSLLKKQRFKGDGKEGRRFIDSKYRTIEMVERK